MFRCDREYQVAIVGISAIILRKQNTVGFLSRDAGNTVLADSGRRNQREYGASLAAALSGTVQLPIGTEHYARAWDRLRRSRRQIDRE